MAKFIWQDGALVSKAKVEVDGVTYEVDPEEYSGTTPLSASNLNAMVDGIYDDIGDLTNLSTTTKSSIVGAINEINENNIYSTTEQRIGTWTNGKPLYRIVIFFNNVPGTGGVFSIAQYNLNIDEIGWFTSQIVQFNNGQYETPYYVSDDDRLRVLIQVPNNDVIISKGSSMDNNNKVTLIIHYTKTTD